MDNRKFIILALACAVLSGCSLVKSNNDTSSSDDTSYGSLENIEGTSTTQVEYSLDLIEDEEKKENIRLSDEKLAEGWQEDVTEDTLPSATYAIPEEYQYKFSNYIQTDRPAEIGVNIDEYKDESSYLGYTWNRITETICKANYSLKNPSSLMTIEVGTGDNFNQVVSVFYPQVTSDMLLFIVDDPITSDDTFSSISIKIGQPYTTGYVEDDLFGIWYSSIGRKYTIEFDGNEEKSAIKSVLFQ